MADARGGQSSVRSLLAKFEHNNNNANASSTTSPPSRGRSPAASDHSASDRPLSKVRASFVAVERAAQSSPARSPSGLRKSVELDDNSPDNAEDDATTRRLASPIERFDTVSPTDGIDKRVQSRPSTSSPPEQPAVEQSEPNKDGLLKPGNVSGVTRNDTPALGDILKGAPFEESPSKKAPKATGQLPSDSPRPKKDTETPGLSFRNDGKAHGTATESVKKPGRTAKTDSSRPSNIAVTKDLPAKSTNQQTKSARTPTASGPRQHSTTTTNSTAANKQTERPSRITVKKPSSVRASSHPAGKAPAKPKSEASETSAQNGEKSSTHSSPRNSKKQPRSPTRPVRLPSSMTASTASSAAKLGNNNSSNSSNAQTTRPASRATGNTATYAHKTSSSKGPGNATLRPSTPATSTTVRKRASHASMGPSSTTAHDRPRSRISSNTASRAPADDSFLTRMMRPTASSASKTQEKKPEVNSPPSAPKSAEDPQRKVTPKNEDQQQNGNSIASTGAPSVGSALSDVNDRPASASQHPDIVVGPDKLSSPEQAQGPAEEQTSNDTPMPTETETAAEA